MNLAAWRRKKEHGISCKLINIAADRKDGRTTVFLFFWSVKHYVNDIFVHDRQFVRMIGGDCENRTYNSL